MRRLRDAYLGDARVAALADAVRADRELLAGACTPSFSALLIAALAASGARPPLVVAPDPAGLCADLEELGTAVVQLPELERFADEDGEHEDESGWARRMAALTRFSRGALLVASPLAAEQPVPDLEQTVRSGIILRPGESHPLATLVERLADAGFRPVPVVEAHGELAVRGGLLDIWPLGAAEPLRIELFGDEIDTIRRFDPLTQETIARTDEAVLVASRGGLATRDLWSQLPPGPLLVLGDAPLRARLGRDHGRREVRLARSLEGAAVDGAAQPVEQLRGDLRRELEGLRALLAAGGTALLLARNEESAKELAAHAADAGLAAEVRVGRLSAGFRDAEHGLVVAHDFELAARAAARRRARIAGGQPLSSLADLRSGDHVVHLQHGIALFRGMATLEKRGYLEDFLILEFSEGSKLYVPVEAIDQVQKYVGATGRAPELSRLGGATWAKRRARAQKAVEDISGELLAAQARRVAAGGVPCPPDTPRQRQFEAAFPFEETEDQLAAVREIKADLEKPVAMDRLLCGDVGFGKTEVAMRAVFKVVESGRQAAVLVPTTLLAEQHLESFQERCQPAGLRIAGLNRFRSAKERGEVLARAAAGEVDIIIGTHALLSEKLAFADLGLLVVDEEHRFGVKQKEKLRDLARRAQGASGKPPHVLTLSATPIPRTLHFSLLGLRDISVLAEPPAERMAVETHVAPWDDQLVRHALERERERQGQVFVVHPRIEDLDKVAWRISKLAPGLRLDAVHGQMDEDRLARVMDAFRRRDLDCLVSTSIIESGIDIPNANTLFVTESHRYGLAELHQLRGRIGRFTRQAYAYFLTPPNREIGEEARERLAAIQEYADLGAGFKLAMRDLELRGAGNLLGADQSGQIDAIGYELYAKMLAEEVERVKSGMAASAGKPSAPDAAPAALSAITGLHLDAYIPDSWLEAPQLKFELHKAIDGARRLTDLAAAATNARDRFGALPDPVLRLFRIKAIRLRLREWGLARIDVGDRRFRLYVNGRLPPQLAQAKLPELLHIQPDGPVLVLFMRPELTQDVALDLLCRLLALDLGFLGAGF